MIFSSTVLLLLSSFVLSEHLVLVEGQSSKAFKKSAKKGTKSSKGSKASPTASPTKPLSQAEKYFGVLPDEVAASYIRIEDTGGYVNGVPFIFGNSAQVDYFQNRGVYSLEEVETICMIKCEENPLCSSIEISVGNGPEGRDDLQYHQCRFFNPTLGTIFSTDAASEVFDSTFFYKEGTLPPLAFEDFACDVGAGSVNTEALVNCLITQGTPAFDAVNCPPLLTEDALQYIAPSVFCVAGDAIANGADVQTAIYTCLGCTSLAVNQYNSGALDPCVVSAFVCNDDGASPGASLFGAPNGSCIEACPSACVEDLKIAGVCTLGALPEVVTITDENDVPITIGLNGGCVGNGIPGLDPFTCPSADFVAPTAMDYAAFLVENSM